MMNLLRFGFSFIAANQKANEATKHEQEESCESSQLRHPERSLKLL